MKSKKKIIILTLFILLIFCINTAYAEDTESINNINETNHETSINESPTQNAVTGTYTELKTLIDNANSGDTITLNKSYTYNSGTDSKITYTGIVINKKLTINGNGYTLNGNNAMRLFNIKSDSVTLENTIIKNHFIEFNEYAYNYNTGYINYELIGGGAIYWIGNYGTIINCTFINNNGEDAGGAIFWGGKSGQILNSTFINNTAALQGGVIEIYNSNENNISGNTFIDNTGDYGGAICLFNSSARNIIEYNVFLNNKDYHGYSVNTDNNVNQENSINNNWWGTNTPEFKYYEQYITNFAPQTWIIMNFTTNNEFITTGGENILTVSLNTTYNKTSQKYSEFYEYLINRTVNYNANTGSLNPKSVTFTNTTSTTYTYPAKDIIIVNATIDNQTLTLTNIDNQDSFTELNQIIEDLTGNELNLTKNYTFNINKDLPYLNGIIINKEININGNGYTINGLNKARIFNITANNIKINNLTIINGYNSVNGGAIYWDGANGIINNTEISNSTSFNGGAIYSNGANLNIINATFTNNNAEKDGGAIYFNNHYINIINSTFTHNHATYYGGTIYTISINSNITNSTFTNNTAGICGGALHLFDFTNGQVTGNTFVENGADTGGAICLAGDASNINITQNIIVNNTDWYENTGIGTFANSISNINLNENWWGENKPKFKYFTEFIPELIPETWIILKLTKTGEFVTEGGDIILTASLNTLYNNTNNKQTEFTGNIPDRVVTFNVTKGTVNPESTTINKQADTTYTYPANAEDLIISATVDNQIVYLASFEPKNTFTALQGLIDATPDGEELNLTQNYTYSTIFDTAYIDGVIIDKQIKINGNQTLINGLNLARIFKITGDNVIINNITFINGTSSENGGTIYWIGTNGIINNSLFENNTALSGGAINWEGENGQIINSTFKHNLADNGGAVSWTGMYGIINSTTFIDNNASNGGALSWDWAAYGILTNSIFNDNHATGSGGAVSWSGINGLIDNTTFTNNTATTNGGAVDWSALKNGLVINSTFINNTATTNGGGIFWGLNNGNGTVIDSTFIKNNALTGGAYYWGLKGNGTIINSTFINNTANEGGAVLWYYGDDGTILNSTFINNTATIDGGAIQAVVSNNFKADNNLFIKNYAKETGGAILLGSKSTTKMIAYITNSQFINNTASINGGGINVFMITGIIENNTFDNNTATTNGGAINIESGDAYNITNNNFTNNTATSRGGAIYLTGSTYTAIINFCNFEKNYASDVGGGIANFNSKTNITNSNFTNNTATRGGGLACVANNNYVYNSKFTNNYAAANGGGIFWNNAYGTISNSILNNNFAESNGGAIYWGGANGNITNTNFTGNTANNGGALVLNGANTNITNANFTNNSATTSGGAIYINKNNIQLTNTIFEFNTAEIGSGIYNNGENTNINNIILTENQAKSQALIITTSGIQYNATLIGGNNILNGIYNNKDVNNILIDGTNPVLGAENSNDGALLYQDQREYNQKVNALTYNNNNILTNTTLTTDIYGTVTYTPLTGTKLEFTHYNDTYYTAITNTTNAISDNTYSSLWRLIRYAIENNIDEINLTKDYTYSKTKDLDYPINGIEINKNLKINGNGHALNGLNTAKLFTLTNSNLILNNITITKHKSENGGAINSENSNVTIFNSTLRDNLATGNGGFIYFTSTPNSYLNISNSIITNNTATEGNDIYSLNNVNIEIDNNWWGNNTPFDSEDYNKRVYDKTDYVKANNWFVMNFTTTKYTVDVGESLILTTSLNTVYNDATDTFSPASVCLPTSTVSYSGGYKGSSKFIGSTNLNFPTTSSGHYTETAKIDDMVLSLDLTVNQPYIPPAPVVTIIITVSNVSGSVNEKVIVPVTVYNSNGIAQNGNISVLFNKETINCSVVNGVANVELTLPKTSGVYSIIGTYKDYTGIGYATVGDKVNETVIISIGDLVYPSNSNVNIIVNVSYLNGTKVNSGNVTLKINGTDYQSEVENGIATLNIKTPDFGYYEVTATYNNQTDTSYVAEFAIGLVETELNVTNLTKVYGTSDDFKGYLLNADGSPIIGQHLNLKLTRLSSGANKVYDVVTDYKGEFSLQINLAPGLYSAEVEYPGLEFNNWKYLSSNASADIQVTSANDTRTVTIITTEKFVEPYGAGKSFTGTLTSVNGNVIAGHHIAVTLTRLSSGASKTYDVVTDYKGIFNLAINLAPGEYTGYCAYAGTSIYQPSTSQNTITVY